MKKCHKLERDAVLQYNTKNAIDGYGELRKVLK